MRLVLIGAGVVAALALLWLPTARLLSLLVDRAFTVAAGGAPASPVGWDGVDLRFPGSTQASSLTLEGPAPGYAQVATAVGRSRSSGGSHHPGP